MLYTLAGAVLLLGLAFAHRSSPLCVGFFFDSRVRSESLRAPGHGVSGWIARKLMAIVNAESNSDVVEALLDVQSGHKVIELGPGHGFSLRIILRKQPEHVYAIEVSESFRSLLLLIHISVRQSRAGSSRYEATPGRATRTFPRRRSIVFLG